MCCYIFLSVHMNFFDVIVSGSDPEINQGGGWLTFQVKSFMHVVIVSITIATKFKDMKWGV